MSGIKDIWMDLKDDYQIALHQSIQQGSPLPLYESMQANADSLKEEYGLDLYQILNMTPEEIEQLRELGGSKPQSYQRGKGGSVWLAMFGVVMIAAAGGILYKELKR